MKVYLAWYDYQDQYSREHNLLGVFSSEKKARQVVHQWHLPYLQVEEVELDTNLR